MGGNFEILDNFFQNYQINEKKCIDIFGPKRDEVTGEWIKLHK
jgi:hypothetical protein